MPPPTSEAPAPTALLRLSSLARREDALRTTLTTVLRELRQLEKVGRAGGASEAQLSRLRHLRTEQTRLHAELGQVRRDLAVARADAAGSGTP